jgi:hypothetical protein
VAYRGRGRLGRIVGIDRSHLTRQMSRRVAATVVVNALALTTTVFAWPAQGATIRPDEYWLNDKNFQIEKVWQITRGEGVIVAVVDTGVNDRLGDLRGQVLPGGDMTGGGTDGRVDVGDGQQPAYGHGSHMAALIAGTGNGAGMVGVAPGAKVLPVRDGVKTGAKFDGTLSSRGIRWAVDHGAKVINVSSGGPESCSVDRAAAVAYAYEHDVIVVAASGNAGAIGVDAPASCPGAVAVGAVDSTFHPLKISNQGKEIAFVEPGYAVPHLQLDDTINPGGDPLNSGTSDSAALLSGIFALIRAKFPKENVDQVLKRALYGVHNGLGDKVFFKRVNNQVGYGQPLPYFALTLTPPPGSPNPIVDTWRKDLAPTTPGSPSAGSASPPGAASQPAPGNGPTDHPTAAKKDGGGPGILIAALVGAVVVVGAGIALLTLRGRRGKGVGSLAAGYPPSAPRR